MTVKQESQLLLLTEAEHQLLIGALLGDGCSEYNGLNCRIRFDHSITQKDYVYWKKSVLEAHFTILTEYNGFDKRSNVIRKKNKILYTY